MGETISSVVCDAGPVIHLDELECLFLLHDFKDVLLPEAVFDEVRQYRPSALKKLQYNMVRARKRMAGGKVLSTMCKLFALDAGETEALSIMEENPWAIFLTDDASARLVADQMHYKVHGTVGILVRGIRCGHFAAGELLNILSSIPSRSTLHIKPSLLEEIIIKIKEAYRVS